MDQSEQKLYAKRSNELRVFISSTFQDLQTEREYLVKKIFPHVRAVCRERGITFTEVDLRWGITEEIVTSGRVIRTCLEEIDRTRPYFIGITGDRYGFVPQASDISSYPELVERFPWIEEAIQEGASLTDLEFRYGALHALLKETEGQRAIFYFKRQLNPRDAVSPDYMKLTSLERRVRERGFQIQEFTTPQSLGERVRTDLLEILDRDFSESRPPSPLESERVKHEAFAASRRHAYLPNQEYLDRLDTFANSEEPPLIIYAESGAGKSALVAHWAADFRQRNPGTAVIEHYIGIGAGATDHFGVMRHIMEEVKTRFDRTEEIPSTSEKLERQFVNWLGFTLQNPVVIIIDGVNQLSGVAAKLEWLPRFWPKNIRFIITAATEETRNDLRQRNWSEMSLRPLLAVERKAIIVQFLREYGKALSNSQIEHIANDPKCAHPLFLRTLLEELRIFGSHSLLPERVTRCLATNSTDELFQVVLERMEEDFGVEQVSDVMSLIWASRTGLAESELVDIANITRLDISMVTMSLDYHLLRRNEILTFFHDFLRRAVESRYLTIEEDRRLHHLALADYFEKIVMDFAKKELTESPQVLIPLRLAHELTCQLDKAHENERMAKVLASIPVFWVLYKSEYTSYVLALWQQLFQDGHEPEKYYRAALDTLRKSRSPMLPMALTLISAFFEARSNWRFGVELLTDLLEWAEEQKDETRAMDAHRGLGILSLQRGNYDVAMTHLAESVRIAESLGQEGGMSIGIGSMGNVHYHLGRYAEAMVCYERYLAISESIGNKHGMSQAIGNMGSVHDNQGRSAEAMACYEKHLAMAESLGDMRGMSQAIGNKGLVLCKLGRYAEAMSCYDQSLSMVESLGDKGALAATIGNMGEVYAYQGRYVDSMACYERYRAMAESLGDKSGVMGAIGNIGNVHLEVGSHKDALEALRDALARSEEIRSLFHQAWHHAGIARAMLELADGAGEEEEGGMSLLNEARQSTKKCMSISEEISMPDTLFLSRVLLTRIDSAEGNVALAREKLEAMLTEATEEEQIADLHYWLWKMAATEAHQNQALTRIMSLYSHMPKFELRKRIAELKGDHIPMSADDMEDTEI